MAANWGNARVVDTGHKALCPVSASRGGRRWNRQRGFAARGQTQQKEGRMILTMGQGHAGGMTDGMYEVASWLLA